MCLNFKTLLIKGTPNLFQFNVIDSYITEMYTCIIEVQKL